MGPNLLCSALALAKSSRHVSWYLGSTWARAHSARHWPDWLDSTWVWTDSAQHRLVSTLLDMDSADSTWALAHSARLRPWLTRFNFGLGRLSSTIDLTQLWHGSTQLDLSPDRLNSIWTRTYFARLGPGLTRLNLEPGQVKIQPKIHFG